MKHLSHEATAGAGPVSPDWKPWRGVLIVTVWRVLVPLVKLARGRRVRRLAAYLGVFAALAVQGAMLLTAAYLIDLAISLMELWTDLARKHLELTL